MAVTKIDDEDAHLQRTLAHHDTAITGLTQQVRQMQGDMRSLQVEVHGGFTSIRQDIAKEIGALASRFDKLDARPQFNFHQSVSTVLQLAVLFSMVVTGIIWVTTGQFGGMVAEQKSLNAEIRVRLEKHDALLDRLAERSGWSTTTKKSHDR